VHAFSRLSKCCSEIDHPNNTIECVQHEKNLEANKTSQSVVTFASFFSSHVLSYAGPAVFVNVAYSMYRGYNTKLLTEENGDFCPDDRRWNKILAILDGFDGSNKSGGWAKDSKYLVVHDIDLIMTNFDSLDIEQIMEQHPKAHLILSADVFDVANTGFIIARNSRFTIDFIQTWYASRDVYPVDQHAFNQIYNAIKVKKSGKKIVILPRG
jgi:hypothetical protein